MVFCHEWVQVRDGRMMVVELSSDLKSAVGKPFEMFVASSRPDAPRDPKGIHVTDGPWLHRTASGELLMTWSSIGPAGYAVYVTQSKDGKLAGSWGPHKLVFSADGGHGMIFKAFDGQLKFVLHQPNSPGEKKRAKIFNVIEENQSLKIVP